MAKKKPTRKKKSAKKPARPKKKIILKKKLAPAKSATKKKPARGKNAARRPPARRRVQSDCLAPRPRPGPRRRRTIRRQPRPLAPGSSRLRKRGRIDGRRSGIRGRSDQRGGKRPRPRPG